MRTREQARKNWTKAAARAKRLGCKVVATKTPEYKAMIAVYQACPSDCEVDHIVPLKMGGPHHPANLQVLPMLENRRKGARIE